MVVNYLRDIWERLTFLFWKNTDRETGTNKLRGFRDHYWASARVLHYLLFIINGLTSCPEGQLSAKVKKSSSLITLLHTKKQRSPKGPRETEAGTRFRLISCLLDSLGSASALEVHMTAALVRDAVLAWQHQGNLTKKRVMRKEQKQYKAIRVKRSR